MCLFPRVLIKVSVILSIVAIAGLYGVAVSDNIDCLMHEFLKVGYLKSDLLSAVHLVEYHCV